MTREITEQEEINGLILEILKQQTECLRRLQKLPDNMTTKDIGEILENIKILDRLIP